MTMLKSLLAATALSLAARSPLSAQIAVRTNAAQQARILGAHDGAARVERTTVTTERAEVRDDRREARQSDEPANDRRKERHDRRDWAHDRNDARKAAKAHKAHKGR